MEVTFRDYGGRYLKYEKNFEQNWYRAYMRMIQFRDSTGKLCSYVLSSQYYFNTFCKLFCLHYEEEYDTRITCNITINIPTGEECKEIESVGIYSLWDEEGEF